MSQEFRDIRKNLLLEKFVKKRIRQRFKLSKYCNIEINNWEHFINITFWSCGWQFFCRYELISFNSKNLETLLIELDCKELSYNSYKADSTIIKINVWDKNLEKKEKRFSLKNILRMK